MWLPKDKKLGWGFSCNRKQNRRRWAKHGKGGRKWHLEDQVFRSCCRCTSIRAGTAITAPEWSWLCSLKIACCPWPPWAAGRAASPLPRAQHRQHGSEVAWPFPHPTKVHTHPPYSCLLSLPPPSNSGQHLVLIMELKPWGTISRVGEHKARAATVPCKAFQVIKYLFLQVPTEVKQTGLNSGVDQCSAFTIKTGNFLGVSGWFLFNYLSILFLNSTLCICTHRSLGFLWRQKAFSLILLPDCFSTDVFLKVCYESLMLRTFSLQSARAVKGSDDMSLMSASPHRIHNYGAVGCVPSGELWILGCGTLLQTAAIAGRKRSIAFTPSPFSPH